MKLQTLEILSARKRNRVSSTEKASKKLEHHLLLELVTLLEENLQNNDLFCFEVPERVLSEFVNILGDPKLNIYSYTQETETMFIFSEKKIKL